MPLLAMSCAVIKSGGKLLSRIICEIGSSGNRRWIGIKKGISRKPCNRVGDNQINYDSMKKLLIPVLTVVVGIGAAFAGNQVSKSSKIIPTYRIEGTQCVEVNQDCDNGGDFLCTLDGASSVQLYQFKLNETTCSTEMHRSQP